MLKSPDSSYTRVTKLANNIPGAEAPVSKRALMVEMCIRDSPYAKCSEPSGKNQQAGNEEQHLPGERKEDRLLRHPDGKEKVCRHHLETDNRKDRKDDMQTVHRRLDQLRICLLYTSRCV